MYSLPSFAIGRNIAPVRDKMNKGWAFGRSGFLECCLEVVGPRDREGLGTVCPGDGREVRALENRGDVVAGSKRLVLPS